MYKRNQSVFMVDVDILGNPKKGGRITELVVWKVGRQYVHCRYPSDPDGRRLISFAMSDGKERSENGVTSSRRIFLSRDEVYDAIDARNCILALNDKLRWLYGNAKAFDLDTLNRVCTMLGVNYEKAKREVANEQEA